MKKKRSKKANKLIENIKNGREIKFNLRFHDLWRYDFDYLKDLSVHDRNWVKQFFMEMYNGWCVNKDKGIKSVFSDEQALENKLNIIKQNEATYKVFKDELVKYCIKHNKIITEKDFIIIQYQRIANREVKPRKFDMTHQATNVIENTEDKDKVLENFINNYGYIRDSDYDMSEEQKEFLRYFRDMRTEDYIYEQLIVVLDNNGYDVAKAMLDDLIIVNSMYKKKEVNKDSFLNYMYKIIAMIMFLLEEDEDKRTIKILMKVYDNVIYKKAKLK
jgi:hypothetical protein